MAWEAFDEAWGELSKTLSFNLYFRQRYVVFVGATFERFKKGALRHGGENIGLPNVYGQIEPQVPVGTRGCRMFDDGLCFVGVCGIAGVGADCPRSGRWRFVGRGQCNHGH